jgi:O-antigen ligase
MAISVSRTPPSPTRVLESAALVLSLVIAGVIIGALPISWAGAMIISLGIFALGLIRLEWALAAVVLSVPFGALRPLDLGDIRVTGTEVATFGVFLAWALDGVARHRFVVRGWLLLGALATFIAAITLSIVQAESLTLGLKDVLKWIEFLVVFLAVVSLTPQRAAPILMGSLFVVAAIEALLGWTQFLLRLGPPGFTVGGLFLRAYGTFGQPNPYAGFLGFALPVAVALTLYRPAGASPWWSRYAPWLALFVGAAMLMSFSRGAWLAASMAIALLFSLSGARGLTLVLVGGLVAALLLFLGGLNLLPDTIAGRLSAFTNLIAVVDVRQAVVTPENWSLVERMVNWQTAWAMYEGNPWYGIGLGNFGIRYLDFVPLKGWPNLTGHAHNYYLTLLGETGIVGLSGYLLFLLTAFGAAIAAVVRAQRTSLGYALSLGVLAALVAHTLHNGFDSLYVQGMTTLLAALLGLVVILPGLREVGAS